MLNIYSIKDRTPRGFPQVYSNLRRIRRGELNAALDQPDDYALIDYVTKRWSAIQLTRRVVPFMTVGGRKIDINSDSIRPVMRFVGRLKKLKDARQAA